MDFVRKIHFFRQDERTINTFGLFALYGAGVATPDPGEAPPMAGFIERPLVT